MLFTNLYDRKRNRVRATFRRPLPAQVALCSVVLSAFFFPLPHVKAQGRQELSSDFERSTATSVSLPADSTTTGSVTLRDKQRLAYTTHAGTLLVAGTDADDLKLKDHSDGGSLPAIPDGRAFAAMSYVAYFANGDGKQKRPVIFFYDGGPSVSSGTLLVSSFGPVLADLPGVGSTVRTPYASSNNPDSLLDVADLVFIDPPGTGYGRVQGRDLDRAFYGIDSDAAAFDRFIRRFLNKYSRWESPKYLFGHSYGTMRSAVLARDLQEDGIGLNGIISVDGFLSLENFPDAASGNPGNDNAYVLQLSTFAATAWYYHKVTQNGALQEWLRIVDRYAMGAYAAALLAGSDLPAEEEQKVAKQLSLFTGIPEEIWIRSHLRLQAAEFEALLLSDQGLITGRQDTRYSAPALHGLALKPGYDASGIKASAVQAVLETYLHDTLHFGADLNYQQDADVPGRWEMFHATDSSKPWLGGPNVLTDLAAVMTRDANIHVLVLSGLFDLATPYQVDLFEVNHLPMSRTLKRNIECELFPTGHEPYLDTAVRENMHDVIARFILKRTVRL